MSVFTPLDVRAPIDRRKQLLNRLMQQYQSSVQSSAATPMPGAVHAAPSPAGGRPFHSYGVMPAFPHAQVTQQNDVAPDVAAQLGPGGIGNPNAAEHSPVFGAPLPIPMPANVAQAPSQPNPGPTPSGGPTPPPPPPPGVGLGAPPSNPGGGSAPPRVPTAGLIPLGNGLAYDPAADAVRPMPAGPAPVAGLGAAARSLPGTRTIGA